MSKVAKLDMYNMEKPHEVESIVKNKRQKELQLENFLTIDALKGKQFGHEIYVTVLRFKEVQTFLETFQDVQRQIMPHKVASIKRYILTGLKKNPAMRFFPSLTVTARGHLFFEESSNRLAIDVRKSKLSINDGQHRYTSCVAAIDELKEKIARSKDEEDKFILRSELKELEEMVLPITIFNNLSESEERQLFYDTNSLAQRPSRSTTIRLAQTDLWSKLARELSVENRYLSYYGVEMEKGSIAENNPNTVLLTTVYEMAKRLNWEKTKVHAVEPLTEETFDKVKAYTSSELDKIFFHLPNDLKTKGKYLIEKNYVLKAIAKFIFEKRRYERLSDEVIFGAISSVNWENDFNYWKQYNAVQTKTGNLSFGDNGTQSTRAIYDTLDAHLPSLFNE